MRTGQVTMPIQRTMDNPTKSFKNTFTQHTTIRENMSSKIIFVDLLPSDIVTMYWPFILNEYLPLTREQNFISGHKWLSCKTLRRENVYYL